MLMKTKSGTSERLLNMKHVRLLILMAPSVRPPSFCACCYTRCSLSAWLPPGGRPHMNSRLDLDALTCSLSVKGNNRPIHIPAYYFIIFFNRKQKYFCLCPRLSQIKYFLLTAFICFTQTCHFGSENYSSIWTIKFHIFILSCYPSVILFTTWRCVAVNIHK